MHRGDLSIKLKMDIIVSLTDTKRRAKRQEEIFCTEPRSISHWGFMTQRLIFFISAN